jgi:hypothetical protein
VKYYVYQLVDPRNERIFYIGKGTGSRWRQHMHKPKKVVRRHAGNWLKDMVIDSLRNAGLEPECRKIGLFADPTAAYMFEAECIAEHRQTNPFLANHNDGIRPHFLAKRQPLKEFA